MFVSERRDTIMDLLKKNKRITVKGLSSKIGVSEATLRTDLNQLEQDGLLTRTHGGAVLNDTKDEDVSFSVRSKKNKDEKMKIAEEAIHTIKNRQCILLDGSSTVLELARYISKEPLKLTVVTSGLQTAIELKENPDITVILIGGVASKGSSAIEGTLGIDLLDQVNIDTMYTSANGFTIENGLTDFNLYEVSLKREMIKRADKVVALIDSSKIGAISSAVFAQTEEIDILITDKSLPEEIIEKPLLKDIEVIISNN